jgi:hypothetical protein
MTYFNAVTRLQETVTGDDGKTRQAYKCNECSLVWGSGALAIDCAVRNHRNRYPVEYTREHLIDGKVALVELTYVRQALRQDGPIPQKPSVKPVSEARGDAGSSVQTPVNTPQELDLQALKALALTLGYRLSRVPVAKAKAPVDEEQADNDRLDSLYDEPVF